MSENSVGRIKKQVQNKAKMDKKTIGKIVKDLIRRRQWHQARINKLLNPNYHQNDATQSSQTQQINEFSEILNKIEGEEPVFHESIGSLANHVNLLATVSLKTQYFLAEKHQVKEYGHLYSSLLAQFASKEIKYDFNGEKPKGAPKWLQKLVEYLLSEDLANGIFVASQGQKGSLDFYGTFFQRGKHEQILLSKEQIEQQQLKLTFHPVQQPQGINISWVLLWRLLGRQSQNMNMPLAVNKLFSFPYRTFLVGKSLDLIAMNDILYNIQKEVQANQLQHTTLKLYGIQSNYEIKQIEAMAKSKTLNKYAPIIHEYESVLIMNQIQFPVKSVPLSCLKHHFVVVTLIVKQKGYYYLNIGGKNCNQRFRMCLIDFENNLVQYDIVNNGQFMLSQLRDEQYELYISPQGIVQESEPDQSFELVKEKQQQFSLWVQGRGVCSKKGDLQLEIRLKQQYNSYTIQIAKKYIEDNSKRPQEIVQFNEVTIKRYGLRLMNLFVDTLISPTQSKLTVKYKSNTLCDQFFQDSKVTLKHNECIALRENTEIQEITAVDSSSQKLPFKIIYFFL